MGLRYKRPLKTGDIFASHGVDLKVHLRYLCLCDGDKTRKTAFNVETVFKFKCLVLYSDLYWIRENSKVNVWLTLGDFLSVPGRNSKWRVEHSLAPETKENNQKESS